MTYPGAEASEEFPCQVAEAKVLSRMFPADMVVQNLAFGGPINVGKAQVHAVPFNRAGHPADERDGPIGVLALDDADMGQRVVHPTVPVGVPGIVEKNEITRTSSRPLVKLAMFPDVV